MKKGKKVWQSGKKVVRKIKTSFVIPKEATNTLKYVKKGSGAKISKQMQVIFQTWTY
ncbi:hypothetical protein BAOM_2738 [Peribacillus asahii]|uniref:Uncharacterized protein n=1 Tax=Peribacillus asahii TaxID=228899 RepID=A0A3T0KSH8_9BACI|nr:hypothetical protein [Peribacillus asahii]AZV43347.1 hypothetical protein BAOM_2738 [Peribacillus asahii]